MRNQAFDVPLGEEKVYELESDTSNSKVKFAVFTYPYKLA